MKKIYLTWEDVREGVAKMLGQINGDFDRDPKIFRTWHRPCTTIRRNKKVVNVYAVPRGGDPVLLELFRQTNHWQYVIGGRGTELTFNYCPDLHDADIVVDDIIDSGFTKNRILAEEPDVKFYAMVNPGDWDSWVVFPWEKGEENGPTESVTRIIEFIGDDPKREGLLETPSRVIRSYEQMFSGYKKDPASVFKVFEDGACDEMVILKNTEFSSTCEHHMLPFVGKAHIAYIPKGRVIGVSKLARLLDIFARRLQIQERLCQEVTGALNTHLAPLGSACIIEAQHLCMTCRGVEKQHSKMLTSSLTGVFRNDPAARAELFSLIK